MAKKKKNHLKGLAEDVTVFGGSQLMLGGFGITGASMGANLGGLSAVSRMSRPLGTVIPLKHTIGMLEDVIPKSKKKRR